MSRKRDDLVGRQFSYLTVVEFDHIDKGGNAYWVVECICEKRKVVRASHLKDGTVTNCSCISKVIRKANCKGYKENLIGTSFGRLTVLDYAGLDNTHNALWLVKCVCGVKKVVRGFCLKNGSTVSCGCYNEEMRSQRATTHGKSKTKEYNCFRTHKYRDLKKKLDVHWNLDLELTLRNLQPFCALCGGKDKLSVDHVLPLSKGYGLSIGNAVILCNRCNASKGNKNLYDLPWEHQLKIIRASEKFYFTCLENGLFPWHNGKVGIE